MSRKLSEITSDIYANWPKISPYARPYLEAMSTLDSVSSNYYADSGDDMVRYFLSNATSWRGEHARRIKAELKALIK